MRLGASIGKADPAAVPQRARDLEDVGIDILWAAELCGFDAASPWCYHLAAGADRLS